MGSPLAIPAAAASPPIKPRRNVRLCITRFSVSPHGLHFTCSSRTVQTAAARVLRGRMPSAAAPQGRRRRARNLSPPTLTVPAQPRQPSLLPPLPAREALLAGDLAVSGHRGLSRGWRRGGLRARRRFRLGLLDRGSDARRLLRQC